MNIQEISSIAAYATIDELKKQGMLKLEPTAYERTKDDIFNFKTALTLLEDEDVPNDFKKKIALKSINMNNGLKRLKDIVSESDFMIFYQSSFKGQTHRSLSLQYEIDEGTVREAIKRCISELSVYLHPDLFLGEILN